MRKRLSFSIEPRRDAWTWVAYQPDGAIVQAGEADSRAAAAACVIRCLTRAVGAADAGGLRRAA